MSGSPCSRSPWQQGLKERDQINVECIVQLTHIVGSGVKMGNCHRGIVFKLISQLLPGRCHRFAMAAPWRVELDERIALILEHQLVEVLANQCDKITCEDTTLVNR